MYYCPSATAFYGAGGDYYLSTSTKLGGFGAVQLSDGDIDTPFFNKDIFQDKKSAFSMIETYGSNMSGFSSGGFVWAGEMTCNILSPLANLVGSSYTGSIQFGQLPDPGPGLGLTLKELIEISSQTSIS